MVPGRVMKIHVPGYLNPEVTACSWPQRPQKIKGMKILDINVEDVVVLEKKKIKVSV